MDVVAGDPVMLARRARSLWVMDDEPGSRHEPRRAATRRDATPPAAATRLALVHGGLARGIVRALHVVRTEVGPGFLESVYEGALCKVLTDMGIACHRQHPLDVVFRGVVIGSFRADVLVEQQVVVELKVAKALMPIHEAQVLSYLRASGLRLGILANFAQRLEIRRLVL
jgi:GxxExxY protein